MTNDRNWKRGIYIGDGPKRRGFRGIDAKGSGSETVTIFVSVARNPDRLDAVMLFIRKESLSCLERLWSGKVGYCRHLQGTRDVAQPLEADCSGKNSAITRKHFHALQL